MCGLLFVCVGMRIELVFGWVYTQEKKRFYFVVRKYYKKYFQC